MECVFCSIVNKSREAAYVYEDKEFIAIMDKYPISIGHTLVIPKKHYKTIIEMPINEVGMLFALTAHVAKAVIKAVNIDGFSIGQNNGESANQIIPHVHTHIIPRSANDKTRWSSRMFVTLKELEVVAESIRKFIDQVEIAQIYCK